MGQGLNVGRSQSQRQTTVESLIRKPSNYNKPSKTIHDEFADEIGLSRKLLVALPAQPSQNHRNGEFLIRGLDIAGSITVFSITMPVMAGAALLIKVFSPGPVLYKQQRVGKSGKIFTLYKLRTMVNNAEDHTGPVWANENDSRVTKIGRILRRTRLDELPQLFNVLRGDMSLVGPRPERLYFVKLYNVLQGVRLAVKPGLTDLAQIRSRYNLKPEHKLKYDYLYIKKKSLLLNLYILLKTIPIIFSKNGW